ncbi:MAG: rhomboid family intramembrane serine protease [Bacteroidales bacterium]|nr:rhomboid family intramembrane serine protease [Bacteroidales bacterium]
MKDIEKIKLYKSLLYSIIFLIILWSVKIFESYTLISLSQWGVYPLKLKGLFGIFTAPLIHGDFKHLISNTFALFFLTWALFYFYKSIAFRAFFFIYLISGFWVWFFAREAYHIGASGLIYGLFSFLFFSGIFRKHVPLVALSLTVVFLYGGIVWGIFPIQEKVSWETHLTGLMAGVVIAVYYKNEGPQRPKHDWEDEIETEADEIKMDENAIPDSEIIYHYKESEDDKTE